MRTGSVIIVGPRGCGKSMNRERLQEAYGCQHVVDDWYPGFHLSKAYTGRILFLTSEDPAGHAGGARVVPWSEAARAGSASR